MGKANLDWPPDQTQKNQKSQQRIGTLPVFWAMRRVRAGDPPIAGAKAGEAIKLGIGPEHLLPGERREQSLRVEVDFLRQSSNIRTMGLLALRPARASWTR